MRLGRLILLLLVGKGSLLAIPSYGLFLHLSTIMLMNGNI